MQIARHGGSVTAGVTEQTTQLVALPGGGPAARVAAGALLKAVADAGGGAAAVHVLHRRLLAGELHIVPESCDSSSFSAYAGTCLPEL